MKSMLLGAIALATIAMPAAAQNCPREGRVFQYETRGDGGWDGEFRLTGTSWVELNHNGERRWTRVPTRKRCVIKLVEGDATIEIHQVNLSIWFHDASDRHYSKPRNLYRITGVD